MIIGIGIDIIEIARFQHWSKKSKKQLLRIFTPLEIDYCLANKTKSAERFAVRFSAKEAFFKAANPHFDKKISFISLCPLIQISSNINGLAIHWEQLKKNFPYDTKAHLSMTHSGSNAGAIVILERNN